MERATPPDTTIDVRNKLHPVSILKTRWALKQLTEGKTLEVLCNDERTKDDLLCIIHKSPNQKLLGIWKEENYCRILVSRLKQG
jgi:TusA-related sulfurtransferase